MRNVSRDRSGSLGMNHAQIRSDPERSREPIPQFPSILERSRAIPRAIPPPRAPLGGATGRMSDIYRNTPAERPLALLAGQVISLGCVYSTGSPKLHPGRLFDRPEAPTDAQRTCFWCRPVRTDPECPGRNRSDPDRSRKPIPSFSVFPERSRAIPRPIPGPKPYVPHWYTVTGH